MKKVIKEIAKEKDAGLAGRKISRKAALKKAGYLAVSAATTMILLSNPSMAMTGSPDPVPTW